MHRFRLPSVVRQLLPEVPDGELLERYAVHRDNDAFAQLVARYSRLVWGQCRNLLPNDADADDAFQATFLAMLRSAKSIRTGSPLGPWLHGVAYRVCQNARRANGRRAKRETVCALPETGRPVADSTWEAAFAAVSEEIQKLSETQRTAFVLCCIEGRATTDAAALLGLKLGTFSARLTRAKQALLDRLAKRGFNAGLLALSGLTGSVAIAPASLIQRTLAMVSSGVGIPDSIHTLTHGVTRNMMVRFNQLSTVPSLLITGARTAMSAYLLRPTLVGFVGVALIVALTLTVRGLATSSGDAPEQSAANSVPSNPAPEPPAANLAPSPRVAIRAETPAEQLARLKAEYDADIKARTKPQIDVKTGQPIPNQFNVTQPPLEKYGERLLALGRSDDEATAVAALSLAVIGWCTDKVADDAFDMLLDRFAESPLLAEFARKHHSINYIGKYRRLERLLGVASDRTAKGISLLDLAAAIEPPTWMPGGSAAEAREKARTVALYKRVIAEYKDVVGGDTGNGCQLGNLARLAHIFLLRIEPSVRAGLAAPAAVGKDLDGKPMDLANFRDKVVVLDFWGSWCLPCRRNLTVLKEVAGKYADKGVVILGVASEASAEDAAKAAAEEKLPWRSWADLRNDEGDSPIALAWGVTTFPTVAIIDGTGVVRHFQVGGDRDELEKALDVILSKKPKP